MNDRDKQELLNIIENEVIHHIHVVYSDSEKNCISSLLYLPKDVRKKLLKRKKSEDLDGRI